MQLSIFLIIGCNLSFINKKKIIIKNEKRLEFRGIFSQLAVVEC